MDAGESYRVTETCIRNGKCETEVYPKYAIIGTHAGRRTFICFAIGYDTPENYRKRYYKGELPKKQTFENRVLSPEPKFVQKRRQLTDSKDTYEDVSTFELQWQLCIYV